MNNEMFAIRDRKIGAYKAPFVARNKGDASRMFAGAIKQGNTQLSEYPEDFDLFFIGSFNDLSGQLDSVKPEFVCSAVSCMPASAGGHKAPAADAGDPAGGKS